MSMNAAYHDAIAKSGADLIRYIGLVDNAGRELAGGGYARLAVKWRSPLNGTVRPAEDLIFNVPGGSTVAGWRGFDAASGGSEFGGQDVPAEPFGGDGEYRLIADKTGISHRSS